MTDRRGFLRGLGALGALFSISRKDSAVEVEAILKAAHPKPDVHFGNGILSSGATTQIFVPSVGPHWQEWTMDDSAKKP